MKPVFSKGQTVLFQGDSVTDCGRIYGDDLSLAEGYPGKIAEIHSLLFGQETPRFINRGVSGNRVRDVLARFEKDIKELNPDFISILIGINDVWRRYDSNDITGPELFESGYRSLLLKIKEELPKTKIMIMEPFVLHSLPDRVQWHEDLDPKIQVVRKLAREFADYFVPLDGIMAKAACRFGEKALAEDGVHPSSLGHGVIAEAYLSELGIV